MRERLELESEAASMILTSALLAGVLFFEQNGDFQASENRPTGR